MQLNTLLKAYRSLVTPTATRPWYVARLAQSADEVRRAQQLRFEVFNLELGEAAWPLFGWLARAAGTIFVDREHRLSSPRVVNLVRDGIAAGSLVVLFPEGTSSDGTTVLPFKSALLESAVQLRCPLAPASIQYALDHGSVADEVCYWRDMTLLPHLLNLFFKREIRSNCSFSPPRIRAGNRKEIARELREEILSMRS
ncbi:MAG: hypothetical protein DMF44_01520 [Verrucomicrobia bacterium]|nr:MAG: hypothetical protein DMF44_01520 [Verrucomicrobiota bacterium]